MSTEPALRECFGCGQFQLVPALDPDMRSDCVRCGTALRRTRRDPLNRAIALNATALVLFSIVWLAMMMKVSTVGIEHTAAMISGPIELAKHGLWPLGLVVFFTTAIAPAGKFIGTLYVLIGLRLQKPPPNLRGIFLLSRKLGIWAMLEVLLLGVFVAYTKLSDLAHVEIGVSIFALGLLSVLTVWADTVLDPDAVWAAIEQSGQTHSAMPAVPPLDFHPSAIGCEACGLVSVPTGRSAAPHDGKCPRCGSKLHARKPNSLHATWAFVIGAAILYIPANYYPVLTVIQLGAGQPATIIGGVEELLSSGMYPLALLVFFASVLVPMFKLIGLAIMLMATMLVSTEMGASVLLPQRTKLYYAVAWIGRWSMVDIFMESLLGALVQFGSVVTIEPGIGAVSFCGVVILTIFAAEGFDPRLMWDAAGRNAHRSSEIGRRRRSHDQPA
jgi:paraquat-inducible protein A